MEPGCKWHPFPPPAPHRASGRRWACFTDEALEGAIRDVSGIRATRPTRPTSRLPHLVTPLSSCGHLCHLEQWPEHLRCSRGAWTRESGSLEGAMWVPRTRRKVPESQPRGSEQLCRTWQAGGAADRGPPATWLCPCGRARVLPLTVLQWGSIPQCGFSCTISVLSVGPTAEGAEWFLVFASVSC